MEGRDGVVSVDGGGSSCERPVFTHLAVIPNDLLEDLAV